MKKIFLAIVLLLSTGALIGIGKAPSISTPTQGDMGGKSPEAGNSYEDCLAVVAEKGGWCELGNKYGLLSIASNDQSLGPAKDTLEAWGGAAYDADSKTMYFTGGGHGDSADNSVYSFDIKKAEWTRLTHPSPLSHLVKRYENLAVKGQYSKTPDLTQYPGAAHSYDGLVFRPETKTMYYFSMRPANKFTVDNIEPTDSRILANSYGRSGQYEFNPSATEFRHNLAPLSWRYVGSIPAMYPKTAMVNHDMYLGLSGQIGKLVFNGDEIVNTKLLVRYASWGDGSMKYDAKRRVLWLIHDSGKVLLGYSLEGELLFSTKLAAAGKSIVFDSDNNLLVWDGCNSVASYNPEKNKWLVENWKNMVSPCLRGRVYSKWVHVENDIFVGLSKASTGLWLYRKPRNK